MIPNLLLVGLVVGSTVRDASSFRRGLLIGAGVSLLWALLIVLGARSLGVAFGAALVGMANFVVGAVFAAGVRQAIRRRRRRP